MAVLMKLGIAQFIQTASTETWGLFMGICWAAQQDAGQPAYSTAMGEVKRVESAEGSTTGVLISENVGCRETSSLHIISWLSSHCLYGISFRLHWCSWAGRVNSAVACADSSSRMLAWVLKAVQVMAINNTVGNMQAMLFSILMLIYYKFALVSLPDTALCWLTYPSSASSEAHWFSWA